MTATSKVPLRDGMEGFVSDWASDQRAFKGVPWGKAMMWIFLLSDTFIFSIFLISLSNYNSPTNYSPISYRDLFTIIFLIFFIEIQLDNGNKYFLHLLLSATAFVALIFHFDSGVYLYLILFLVQVSKHLISAFQLG